MDQSTIAQPFEKHDEPQPAGTVVVQAYLRKNESFVSHIFGERVHFKTNAKGHVVAYIKETATDVLSRLLDEIPEGYTKYEGKDTSEYLPAPTILTAADTEPSKPLYVISNGEATVDLKAMDDVGLKQFIKDHGLKQTDGKQIPAAAKGNKLRAYICAAVGQGTGEVLGIGMNPQPTAEELADLQ